MDRFKVEKISSFTTLGFVAVVEKVTDTETFTCFSQVIYGDVIPSYLDYLSPELYEQYKKKVVRFDEDNDAVLFFEDKVLDCINSARNF